MSTKKKVKKITSAIALGVMVNSPVALSIEQAPSNPVIQSEPQQANNLFWFLERVMNDEQFKAQFNQATEADLVALGLNKEQIKDMIAVHKILYMKDQTAQQRQQKLHDKWTDIIDKYEDDYSTYLSSNFSW